MSKALQFSIPIFRSILIVMTLGISPIASGQSFIQMMDFADEKMMEGDYYYAISYYRQAMEYDSNSVEVLWKMAEAQRRYKDYATAEFYYEKVYAKENGLIYPKSIFWLATMEQYNGKYEESLEHWKSCKKVFKRKKKSYEYKKSQQSIRSCLWAMKAIVDTTDIISKPLPPPICTDDAELAPVIYENRLM